MGFQRAHGMGGSNCWLRLGSLWNWVQLVVSSGERWPGHGVAAAREEGHNVQGFRELPFLPHKQIDDGLTKRRCLMSRLSWRMVGTAMKRSEQQRTGEEDARFARHF